MLFYECNTVQFATIYSHHVRICYSGQKYDNVLMSWMTQYMHYLQACSWNL